MPESHYSTSLLIIDDNQGSLDLLSTALAQPGLKILTASTPDEGIDLFCEHHPQIVLTDLVMPEMSGMEVLERIMDIDPATDVILMSAHYSTESAVEAIKKGAGDYLNKPVSIGALRERIGKSLKEAQKRQRSLQLQDELRDTAEFEGIVGRSPRMWELFSRIQRVASHYRALLIIGETGSGKDLVARALHRLSPVSGGRFVVLNCSAVVETLFESELFGHVKGSFTGATHDKPGLFEYAHGGTLFLDEIGDMPLATQAKLLRVLQNQEVQRVGALTARKVDVRVVAATNQDLRAAIADKRFREDLYYRLSMVELRTPPLAERNEDLPLLTRHFLRKFSEQYGRQIRGLTHRAQIRLAQHSWPGNVRELENVVGHAAMMTMSDTIDVQDLPPYLQSVSGQTEPGSMPAEAPAAALDASAGTAGIEAAGVGTLEAQERAILISALKAAGGNQSKAARILRIGRDALRYKIKKHNLDTPDSGRSDATSA